jgi:Family of unknown function (DUF5681)
MSIHYEHKTGYRRPPEDRRWKKGQSGNPNGRRNKSLDISQMIDRFFAGKIKITEGDIVRRVSRFEAILLQLWRKAVAGNKRAHSVLMRYETFVVSQGGTGGLEVVVKDAPGDQA